MRLVASIPEPHPVATVEMTDEGRWIVTWRDGRYRQFRRKADALDAAGLSAEQLDEHACAECKDRDGVSARAQTRPAPVEPRTSMMQTRSAERETIPATAKQPATLPAIPATVRRKQTRRG